MYQSFFKRFLDILISLIALPFVLIILIPVSFAIVIDDGFPIFYNGARLGRNMKEFKMFKFRSMKNNAPDLRNPDGTTYNGKDDPRQTKVGKFLRKTSIDELPQIFNVLLGQMSFIGPRPSPLGDKSQYPKEFFKKYQVLPGITGYNQAVARNAATMDERIENDAYYVDNLSFALDVKIIFLTIKSVLSKKNIYRN